MTFTIAIIVITCLVSITSFNRPEQVDKLSFWPYKVNNDRQYYRYITSGFVHADFNHLFFNMLTLFFFGRIAEANFQMFLGGKVYYVILYTLGLVLPDVSTYFKYKDVYGYRAIGASGAVSAVLFSSIFFEPWNTIYVFFILIWAILYGGLFLAYSVVHVQTRRRRHQPRCALLGRRAGTYFSDRDAAGAGKTFPGAINKAAVLNSLFASS